MDHWQRFCVCVGSTDTGGFYPGWLDLGNIYTLRLETYESFNGKYKFMLNTLGNVFISTLKQINNLFLNASQPQR